MKDGPDHHSQIEPHFSGHETFTLRYGWLKKAYDAVKDYSEGDSSAFRTDNATARFGVGKNMVSSIRHWATASGVIGMEPHAIRTESVTEFGSFLFDDKYRARPDTWKTRLPPGQFIGILVIAQIKKTTWFWAFNHFHEIDFEREVLERGLR